MICKPDGPVPAPLMIVGEAPGFDEERDGIPFVGVSGQELNRMLHEAGLLRSQAFVTNVCRTRPEGNDIARFIPTAKNPPGSHWVHYRGRPVDPAVRDGAALVEREIALVSPRVILALGNTALWALTGEWGIGKWRGSILRHSSGVYVVPTYHPALILRVWENRAIAVADMRRAARLTREDVKPPDWRFIVRPSFQAVVLTLALIEVQCSEGPTWIELDIETRHGQIACLGLSWSATEAICIPFLCVERPDGYWNAEEEAIILYRLSRLLRHPGIRLRGQNLLYDFQYIARCWGFVPSIAQDTMVSHHVAFAGLPKRLDFQASMYCAHYTYWKDDGKEWDRTVGENQLWTYNCTDCVRTREVGEATRAAIAELGLEEVEAFQQRLFHPVLAAMMRGVRIDKAARNAMAGVLIEEATRRDEWFTTVLGHPLNTRSTPQMRALFYDDLRQPVILKRGTGQPTLDDSALTRLAAREPLLRPIIKRIAEQRSLGVFLSTFVCAPLDFDGRMRCSFNICGTETFRFSSSVNAFGSGTNLQNIPKGGLTEKDDPDALELPNIRRLFIPDPGQTFFDLDLDRADLQVVVWEADDQELKAALREGVDIHRENARVLGISRDLAKRWVHGTNYGGGPRTMAQSCGITVNEAERLRQRWFAAHPGIRLWHERTGSQLSSRRFVTNRFGYRRHYFERVDGLLPEALAWIPQSTVACVINRIWMNLWDESRGLVEVLLQVHDSLAGQFPTSRRGEALRALAKASLVVIPYEDPLTIPISVKLSTTSWGDCGTSEKLHELAASVL